MEYIKYLLIIETCNNEDISVITEILIKKDFDIIHPNVFLSNVNMVDTILVGKYLKEKFDKIIKNIKFIRLTDISDI